MSSTSGAETLARRFARLARQAFEISGAGLAVQALGAVTTLTFVRLLPVADYAALALCISAIGFISVSSDLGLTSSISYFWRESRRAGTAFAGRFAAVRLVRTSLFVIAGGGAAVTLGVLLARQGLPLPAIAAAVLLVLGIALVQLNGAMTLVTLRLAGHQRAAYAAEIAGAVTRVSLAVCLVALYRESWAALACLTAGATVTWRLARRTRIAGLETRTAASRDELRTVFRYIAPTMPYVLLFAMQDLVVYWCATFRGGAAVVAQTFALGRLSAIFLLLGTLMTNLVMPYVVNSADDRHALRKALLPIVGLVLICLALIGAAWQAPHLFLLLLGQRYQALEAELLLALSAASLQLIAQSVNATTRVMGWITLEPAMTVIQASVLVCGALLLPLGTTHEVLLFSNLLAGAFLFQNIAMLAIGSRRLRRPA